MQRQRLSPDASGSDEATMMATGGSLTSSALDHQEQLEIY
jgi:hypothetical protein